MTSPVPRNQGAPVLQWLLLATVIAGGLGLGLLSQLPGPGPSPTFQLMVAQHRSMAPRLPQNLPEGAAALHTRTVLDGQPADTWLHRAGSGAATVHRFEDAPRYPGSAQELPAPGGPVTVVDLDELSVLCWTDGPTTCVIGSQPVAQLKVLVERVRRSGPGETAGAP